MIQAPQNLDPPLIVAYTLLWSLFTYNIFAKFIIHVVLKNATFQLLQA